MDLAFLKPRAMLLWFNEMKTARGIAYLMTKGHRITGILLSFYLIAHIYTLSGLEYPQAFQAEMEMLKHPFFMFLEWCLVIPLAFHAFNGGRLILFELFEKHEDDRLIAWTLGLSSFFIIMMAVLMVAGTESMTSFSFWIVMAAVSVVLVTLVYQKVWPTFNNSFWKYQRLTGALLLALALGHYFFMHLNSSVGHDAPVILSRMQSPLTFLIDFLLLTAAALHGWYGIKTIIYDTVMTKSIRRISIGLLTFIAVVVYLVGLRLLVLVFSL